MVRMAAKGNLAAMREAADRAEGRPVTMVAFTGGPDPLQALVGEMEEVHKAIMSKKPMKQAPPATGLDN